MSDIKEYKCPHCGGALAFDAQSQKMNCPYCDSEIDIEALHVYDQEISTENKIDWDTVTKKAIQEKEQLQSDSLVTYLCDSCGGEVIMEATNGSFSCPYCGSTIVSTNHFSGMQKPDYIIPFKLDKEAAKLALLNHFKGKKLLPDSFSTESKINEIRGVYVPFWLFNCQTEGDLVYKANKSTHWSDSEYNYTKTDYYMVSRQGNMRFEGIPIDGSIKLDNTYMEALEPFNYQEAIAFDMAYLAGYSAQKYDVGVEDCKNRIEERTYNSTLKQMENTIHGYSSYISEKKDIFTSELDVHYALLPVWLLSNEYQGKVYTFAMNGQTGKFVGDLPVDKKKYWTRFGIYSAITSAIGILVTLVI